MGKLLLTVKLKSVRSYMVLNEYDVFFLFALFFHLDKSDGNLNV